LHADILVQSIPTGTWLGLNVTGCTFTSQVAQHTVLSFAIADQQYAGVVFSTDNTVNIPADGVLLYGVII
jgi:hypothetical protein